MSKHVAPFFTQAELAARAGVTPSAVSEAIRAGTLAVTPTIDGGAKLVARAEGERWLLGRRKPGRPKVAE